MSRAETALITGAASGIGLAVAEELHRRGVRLALVDVDPGVEGVAKRLGASSYLCDVRDESAVGAVGDQVERELGPLDWLFVNAGVATVGPICDLPLADARWVIDVNVIGALVTVQRFVPAMRDAGRGRVVFTGSIASLIGAPGMGAYAASKHAVAGLSESLRVELAGTGVTVTLICPGRVDTGLHGATRYHNEGFERYMDGPGGGAMTAGHVARRAIDGAAAGRSVLVLGPEKIGVWVKRLSPGLYASLASRLGKSLGLLGQT